MIVSCTYEADRILVEDKDGKFYRLTWQHPGKLIELVKTADRVVIAAPGMPMLSPAMREVSHAIDDVRHGCGTATQVAAALADLADESCTLRAATVMADDETVLLAAIVDRAAGRDIIVQIDLPQHLLFID